MTASTGLISGVAGAGGCDDGYDCWGGDGSAATVAYFAGIAGIALDSAGNLYITDNGNVRVRKVTAATNIINTIAGYGWSGYTGDGGQATSAKLNNPQSVTVDSSGNLYIADVSNNRIRKVATSGIISTYAGDGPASSAGNDGGDGGQATSAGLYTRTKPACTFPHRLGLPDELRLRRGYAQQPYPSGEFVHRRHRHGRRQRHGGL